MAFALYGFQSLALATGHTLPGLAPLHALAIGFFGAMLIAMACRVILGHSGQRLAADQITWWIFVATQVTAAVRVDAELAPPAGSAVLPLPASLTWLIVFGIWFARFAPANWLPHDDVKPG